MTNKELIGEIKAEIERRLNELNPKVGEFAGRPLRAINPKTFPRESELEKVLEYLDTLPIDSLEKGQLDGLNAAAEEYADDSTCYTNDCYMQRQTTRNAFKAGAHWMRNIVWHSARDDNPKPNRELLVKTKPNDAYMVLSSNSNSFDAIALEWAYIDDLIPIW